LKYLADEPLVGRKLSEVARKVVAKTRDVRR